MALYDEMREVAEALETGEQDYDVVLRARDLLNQAAELLEKLVPAQPRTI